MGLISRVSSRTYRFYPVLLDFLSRQVLQSVFLGKKLNINMAVNVDFKAVSEQFCKFYYETFSNNRSQLTAVYTDQSCLTFEGDQVLGKDAIVKKLANLGFQKVRHDIQTFDSQPILGVDNGQSVMVSVFGKIFTDDDPQKGFTQTFVLRPTDPNNPGGYFIANETFRLTI